MGNSRKYKNPNYEINQETRDKIEKAVLHIFSSSDFHKANMRTVAKEARVSLETIYNIYGNKEKLLISFLEYWLIKDVERVEEHLKGIGSVKDRLRKFIWTQLDFYERNPNVGVILFLTIPFITWMSDKKMFELGKLVSLLMDVLKQGQAEGILNKKIDRTMMVDFLFGMVSRTFIMWFYRGKKESISGKSDIILEMIWRAITDPERDGTSV